MKRRLKYTLLLLLIALMSLFVLAGCSLGETKQGLLDKYDLVAQVTYYANGEKASFTPGSETREKNIYFPEGVQPYVITEETKIGVQYENYIFDGWYEVELDVDGKPITIESFKDAEGKISHYTYKLGDKVDLSKITLKKGDHLYVAAGWVTDTCVQVKLVHDGDKTAKIPLDVNKVTSANSPVYQKEHVVYGDVIRIANYTASTGELATISANPLYVKDSAYTFLAYYADEACTQPVQWPLKKQETDTVIYAKYIEGDWTIVSTAKDVKDMFSATGKNEHYWIASDIDCSETKVQAKVTFACEIQGNGHTISGLTVERGSSSSSTSMFGTIKETAKIENLHFVGLKLEFTFKPGTYSVYFVFNAMEEGATVTNVTLQGNMNIYHGANTSFVNLDKEVVDNCLYGGYETDAAYEAETDGNAFSFTEKPEIVVGQ